MAKKQSAADRAYQYILQEIVENRLMPGSPIIEQEIADQLNISRTPIREAMKRLEVEGLLISLPYQGTLVATLTTEDIREICNLRSMIELWSLKQGFSLITEEELDHIESLFNEAISPFDPEKYYVADVMLHKLIVNKARSKRLQNMLNTLDVQIMRFRKATTTSSHRFSKSYQEHIEIINDIRNHNYEKCVADLEQHLQLVKEGFVAALRESNFTT